jgi:hypothetical protein
VRAARGGRLMRVVVAAPGVELGFGAVMAWWKGGASGVREVCDGAESRAAREGEARGARTSEPMKVSCFFVNLLYLNERTPLGTLVRGLAHGALLPRVFEFGGVGRR